MAQTLQEKIAVMQAAVDGKKIEWRMLSQISWHSLPSGTTPAFDWLNYDYRVQKEPRVIYVNIYPHGAHYAYTGPDNAKRSALEWCSELAVKFVEVIE